MNIPIDLAYKIMFIIIAAGAVAFTVSVILTVARQRTLLRGQVLFTCAWHWGFVAVYAVLSFTTLVLACAVS